ncbi:hypothetical protein SEA_KENNA_94 [Gordonia phage Kenna]|uniref:Uncharacterized protein n=2 Tax=Getalongvirus kenna TaxID=2734201 RepID=A0A3S9UPZ9_9CAUD|nr:hypothetical protein HOU97_gp94 [Gordonia phage Kenna]AZS12370.1 hypothetical protein SEA_KENNA_94 [Gordonia phage Kenna]QCG77257.1 hypothetical protein SEA_LUTUM_100 [Gordonia phage Lutum]
MSDFWLGVAVIPIAAVAVAVIAAAVFGTLWAFWHWGGDSWQLWPKKWDYTKRARLGAIVATSKVVRRVHIPGGWSLIYCRDKAYKHRRGERLDATTEVERKILEEFRLNWNIKDDAR